MTKELIYLDNNASTAPDPKVIDAVTRAMSDLPGNPASHHAYGLAAAEAVEEARERIAALLTCERRDVVFTSGATEANNLALLGVWQASRSLRPGRVRVLVGETEHPAVLEPAAALRELGAEVVVIPVDRNGVLDVAALEEHVDDRTLLVSVMAANNETGVLSPLREAIAISHRQGAIVHSDATQALGRLPISMKDLDLDMLSMSGHKMHGPRGIGALAVTRSVPIVAVVYGGGHERGVRSGTLNTPGIVGLGVAATLAGERLHEAHLIAQLRDTFVADVRSTVDGVEEHGAKVARLCNTANLRFVGADAEAVIAGMPGIACSAGSACSSALPHPSPVLLAMGVSSQAASESLRFSLSRTTRAEELSTAVSALAVSVAYVRTAMASTGL